MKPVVAIYSTFLQRGYDQLIHDVALQNLDVLFAIDRAGIVGADGPTHQGAFDLSYLRCIPNMVVMAPSNEQECLDMLTTGYQHKGPAAVRYPRGAGVGLELRQGKAIEIGKAVTVKKGQDVAFLNFGTLLPEVEEAASAFNATVIDMRFVKPLDTNCVDELMKDHSVLVTVEENVVAGGAGSAVSEYVAQHKARPQVLNIGLPDEFIKHGSQSEVREEIGLDAKGIQSQVNNFLKEG